MINSFQIFLLRHVVIISFATEKNKKYFHRRDWFNFLKIYLPGVIKILSNKLYLFKLQKIYSKLTSLNEIEAFPRAEAYLSISGQLSLKLFKSEFNYKEFFNY